MQKQYLFLLILFFLSACNRPDKEAQSFLDKAKTLYENAEYNSAKQVLDELKTKYPKEVDLLKERLLLMRQIEWKEQERNLIFCDSLLIVRQAELDSIKAYFVFEKNPEYDATGRYIEKKTAASVLSQRIQTGVNEDGAIYLKSLYAGTSALRHNQLKVSVPSGEYAQTKAIPFDGGANYSFKDDNTGLIHETVTYQKGQDNGVIEFICNYSREKLTVNYLGKRNYSFVLSRQEVESLVKSAALSSVLSEVKKLEKEKIKAGERIKYLQGKLG
jgi:hypothetical protein